ncbi:GNAT family N-acetyltransferase [Lacrimispora sp.]|uniref:GNAT family N-acetyltransferase n=1 Tax=Lacrimispora sp. TaxID=2719234 RepID=UPI0028A8465E|nr:GNAT family N-acetyltransferase [Lacrimispora sp.]
MDYSIRKVRKEDLDRVAEVEALCFPPEEAAGREAIGHRIDHFPESFLVAELSDGTIIGFINGCVTDGDTICDEMFEKADFHNPDGAYQSVFGLDVIKEWRGRGVAAALMKRFMEEAGKRGRKGMILTCKDRLIHYYEKFGYRNMGVSGSVHGGAVWYDMRLDFMDTGK